MTTVKVDLPSKNWGAILLEDARRSIAGGRKE
jgi:hypothetical protein